MIVNHFNTFPYGGAAAAAKRLHREYLRQSIESRFLYHICDRDPPTDTSFHHVSFKTEDLSGWTSTFKKMSEKRRQKNVCRLYDEHVAPRDSNLEVFSMPGLLNQTRMDWQKWSADIVHLHWMAFFADYPSFFGSIPNEVPIVWTLHDMNPLTGGCHYSGGCTRFESGCGNCPQLVNPGPRDASAIGLELKQSVLAEKNITVVTPSHWLADLAQQSNIWPASTRFEVIRLGFDLRQFKPVDENQARRSLGLPEDTVLVGFGAEDTLNLRKGFDLLLGALPKLNCDTEVEFVVFGSGKLPADAETGGKRIHELGYLDGQEKLNSFYNACDAVVVPSREDNSPQIGLEALACGTPVVGFNIGGIPEYVVEQETGLLADAESPAHLAKRISELVNSTSLRQTLGQNARAFMEAEFDIERQAKKYLTLYQSLVLNAPKIASRCPQPVS